METEYSPRRSYRPSNIIGHHMLGIVGDHVGNPLEHAIIKLLPTLLVRTQFHQSTPVIHPMKHWFGGEHA
jgi:hypothetical protein